MPRTRDATQILDRVTDDDEELEQQIARETLNAQVAQHIYLSCPVLLLHEAARLV